MNNAQLFMADKENCSGVLCFVTTGNNNGKQKNKLNKTNDMPGVNFYLFVFLQPELSEVPTGTVPGGKQVVQILQGTNRV